MQEFAEAVVGVPGQGLNVEQRKLLTIGVELAAKPALLLFLDEPTSGLDSQSSWAIVAFLRKLADNGQAVLATIHQPSAILFQEFDRLLFLAKGGRTVYFGDIGHNSETLLNYFESHGADKCGEDDNPAEYSKSILFTLLVTAVLIPSSVDNGRRGRLRQVHQRLARSLEIQRRSERNPKRTLPHQERDGFASRQRRFNFSQRVRHAIPQPTLRSHRPSLPAVLAYTRIHLRQDPAGRRICSVHRLLILPCRSQPTGVAERYFLNLYDHDYLHYSGPANHASLHSTT